MPREAWPPISEGHAAQILGQGVGSDVQISHIQRVLDDVSGVARTTFAHQFGEDIVGQIGLLDLTRSSELALGRASFPKAVRRSFCQGGPCARDR
jgi:hypothetical protein